MRAVSVEHSGHYLATAATDRSVKIWDLRTYKCLHDYTLGAGASHLAFSQRGLLATAFGNKVKHVHFLIGVGIFHHLIVVP